MKTPVVLMAGEAVKHKIGNPTNAAVAAQQAAVANSGSGPGANNALAASNRPAPTKRPIAATYSDGASQPKRGLIANTIPIHAINQFQRGLSVKGRVTSKSAMKQWANERGAGCLFSFDLQDETSEIRVTAFKDQAKQLHDIIQMGQVYIVSKPQVKQANRRFSTLPHEFEMVIADDTVVVPGDENDVTCPQMQYKFVPLNDITNSEPDSFVDVVAIVHRVNDVATIIQKATQKELKKRDVALVDDSQAEISLTLWGREAEEFAGVTGSAIILKKAKVSGYNGRSLNASVGCSIQLDPNHVASQRLKEWYEESKDNLQLTTLTTTTSRDTPYKMLFQVIHEVTHSEQPVFANVRVTFMNLLKTSSYDSCPTDRCKKRVMDMNNGSFRCEKCNKDIDTPVKRFIQTILIGDATGDLYISMFHEDFLKTMLIPEEKLTDICNEPERLEAHVAQSGCRQYVVKLKVFRETYAEQTRTKATVLEINPVDPVAQCRRMIANFRSLIAP